MSANTSIEWTETTWNPVRGCSRISPGCENCYAERIAARFSGDVTDDGFARSSAGRVGTSRELPKFAGFAEIRNGKPRWTGRVDLIPDKLTEPLHWRKPRRVFVNSMSDLFHENLPLSHIAAIFAVMESTPQHTYQILTKRAKRLREILSDPQFYAGWMRRAGYDIVGPKNYTPRNPGWPLPNVHLGVSVENQKYADERIPELLATPAAVRWVSAEPLLEAVDISAHSIPALFGPNKLHWIVVGGESGPGARPFDIAWARSIVTQCKAAKVPVFVKQLGSNVGFVREQESARGNTMPSFHHFDKASGLHIKKLDHPKGGDMEEWPTDLRIREYPNV